MQLLKLLPLASAAAAVQVGVLTCAGFTYKDGALYVVEPATSPPTTEFYVDANSQVRRVTPLGANGGTVYKFHIEEGFLTVDTSPGAFKPVSFSTGGGDNNHWDNWAGFVVYTPQKGKAPKSFLGGFQYAGADRKLYWNQTLYDLQVVDSGSVKGGILIGQCRQYVDYEFDNA